MINPYTNTGLLYSFATQPSPSSISNFIVIQSAIGNYVATLDKGYNQIYVTKITSTPGTPRDMFASATTFSYTSPNPLNSICFED